MSRYYNSGMLNKYRIVPDDLESHADSIEHRSKPTLGYNGLESFTPRAGGLVKGLVHTLALAKSQSICDFHGKPCSPKAHKTEMQESINRLMQKRRKSLYDSDPDESEPRARLNSLISIMVSTIMCLAAKCPIPRSNIQATKLFLSTIVNDVGETPRNVCGLLHLLRNYDGPFEGETMTKPPETIPFVPDLKTDTSEAVKEIIMMKEVTQMTKELAQMTTPERPQKVASRTRQTSKSPVKKSIDTRRTSRNY